MGKSVKTAAKNKRALTAAATTNLDDADPIAAAVAALSAFRMDDLLVTAAVANGVPWYRRARTLVAGQLSLMPFRAYGADGRLLATIPFLRQPDPRRTTSAVLFDTYRDLADHASAYWINRNWWTPEGWLWPDSANPKHRSAEYLTFDHVEDYDKGEYKITGYRDPVPSKAILFFECGAGGWLRAGARAIVTSRMLEDAARIYAETPQPTTVIKNTGPRKTKAQAEELVTEYEAARRSRSTVFVGRDIEVGDHGFDAQQIALSDARSQAVLDGSRVTGVPPLYLAQGIPGSSQVYTNVTQSRLDLHQAMQPFAQAVAARLSFDDVTGSGTTVDVDFGPFLRMDPAMRADLYAKLIPLGVMTVDEARAFESLTAAEGTTV